MKNENDGGQIKETSTEQATRSGWSWPPLHYLWIPLRPWSTSA